MPLARRTALVGSAAVSLLVSACDPSPSDTTPAQPASSSGDQTSGVSTGATDPTMAHVRAIHASPDPLAAHVVVYLDNHTTPVIPSLGYRTAVGYADIAASAHTVQVRLPGIPANSPPQLSWDTPVLLPDHTYTIIAIGLAIEAPAVTFVLDEDTATTPEVRHTNVRFFDAYVGIPSIDICTNTGVPLFADVAYGTFGVSFADPSAHYLDVVSGAANLIVRQHTAGQPCTGHPLGAVDVPLNDRTNQTLVVVGRDARHGTGTQPVAPQVLSCQDAPVARGAAACTSTNIVAIAGLR